MVTTDHRPTPDAPPTLREHIKADYSVVIPAWNETLHLQETLQALQHSMSQQEFEGNITVVDNNSTDDTAAKAAALGANVVFEPVNQIARARNAGAAATEAEWLIFLDADTTINPELLTLTLNAMASGTVIGGGSAIAFDREIRSPARWLVTAWNWWSVTTKAAAGCYLFCTREAFDKVGGFDEKHYAAEELVLSKALRKLAKASSRQFVIFEQAPVISSARKLDWYSSRQKLGQLLLLLIPGATRSKSMLGMWYDRKHLDDKQH